MREPLFGVLLFLCNQESSLSSFRFLPVSSLSGNLVWESLPGLFEALLFVPSSPLRGGLLVLIPFINQISSSSSVISAEVSCSLFLDLSSPSS